MNWIIDVLSIVDNIYFTFDVNSVNSTYSLYKITNGDDQKVTKNTIYCEICIICPQIGKWSILYITVQMFADIFNIMEYYTEYFQSAHTRSIGLCIFCRLLIISSVFWDKFKPIKCSYLIAEVSPPSRLDRLCFNSLEI